ncbi:MAG: glycerol-3-phosphate 1-O-acyltransferase PlsY [Hyphomicrobiales bacterium]|nr:glycerol-3-phosphate 1-O-acyltransferase PlsY [Hyphomicrobiales bacterium]
MSDALSAASLTDIAALAFGYLCGSIPFGMILTKAFGAGDLRSIGSGNIGATNVLRTGRKDLAAATLLLDALKGTFATLIASRWGADAAMAAGLGAFLGHLYPIWLKFRGGKGVATFLGVVLALDWRAALGFAVVWLAVAFATRYSSLAALIASFATFAILYLLGQSSFAALVFFLACVLWWRHRENILRLRAGTESRIGQKK